MYYGYLMSILVPYSQNTVRHTCDIAVSITLGVTAAPTIKVVRTMIKVAVGN